MGLRSSRLRHERRRARGRRIRYDLRSGIPDLSLFPRREWQSAMATRCVSCPTRPCHTVSPGLRQLRVALSDYLGRVRAVVAEPDRVFIAAGAATRWRSSGTRCGSAVLTGRRRGSSLAGDSSDDRAGRARAGPIPVDEHGLDVGELDGAEVDAVVLSPAHQYPDRHGLAPAGATS